MAHNREALPEAFILYHQILAPFRGLGVFNHTALPKGTEIEEICFPQAPSGIGERGFGGLGMVQYFK